MKSDRGSEKIELQESITSIPLFDNGKKGAEHDNLFSHIHSAINNVRQIFRAEISLAKTEVFSEIKNGLRGSAFFIAAAVILLYSSFFFFFTVAFALHAFILPLWASFLVVFLLMVIFAAFLALLGFRKIKKVSKPENTLSTLKSTAAIPSAIKSSN